MAIYLGTTIVKKVYVGSTEIDAGNVHAGGDDVHQYDFTLSFTDAVTNGSFDTTDVTYRGYVGETFTGTRDASADSNYTLSSTTTTKSGTNSSDVDITASSGVRSAWTVTMPQGGGTATITSTGTAAADANNYTFSLWTGSCTATASGTTSCTAGGAASATTPNVSARGFNSGCSNSTHTNVTISVVAPSGYDNAGDTVTGTGNVTQSPHPQVNVGNPTQSGTVAASGGTPSFTNSKYSTTYSFSARGFNSGCSNATASANWTYTETSGNFCNSTDSGTVTVSQSPHPVVPFGTPSQSGTIPNTGGKASFTSSEYVQDSNTDASTSDDGCSTYAQSVAITRTVTSGDYCNNTATGNANVNQLPLSEYSLTTASLADGTAGDTITASDWSSLDGNTYSSTSPTTYQSGTNTYTVTVTVKSGFCNSGGTTTDTDTAFASTPVVTCECVSSVNASKSYTLCSGSTQFISAGSIDTCLQTGDTDANYSGSLCTKASECTE